TSGIFENGTARIDRYHAYRAPGEMAARVAGGVIEKIASGVDLLGVGRMRASQNPFCQRRWQLDDRVFAVERAGGDYQLCAALEHISLSTECRNIDFQVCAPNRLVACLASAG